MASWARPRRKNPGKKRNRPTTDFRVKTFSTFQTIFEFANHFEFKPKFEFHMILITNKLDSTQQCKIKIQAA
jgi:hypothetical protein